MKTTPIIIILFTLISCSNREFVSEKKQTIQNEGASSFETENSTPSLLKDTFLISDFSVNGLRLGMPINDIEKQLLLCDSVILDTEWKEGVSIYYVYYQGEVIMSYDIYTSSITWIDVYSPIFYTKSGFRVGDNIKKLIKDQYKEMYLLEEKETFWVGLYYDLEGFIEYIGLYDTGGFP